MPNGQILLASDYPLSSHYLYNALVAGADLALATSKCTVRALAVFNRLDYSKDLNFGLVNLNH